MKKITLLILCIFSSHSSDSQSFIGYLSDNYSGVNSVISNPANITDSRFKTDINLAGVSAFAGNDYYGINILDATKDGYNFDSSAKTSPSSSNNANLNVDVLGPAFMFNLTKNSSIAVFTRARVFYNVNEINGTTIDAIDDDDTDDIRIDEGNFNTMGNAWGELGLTYARTLLNKKQHFLKGGLTIKYLQGAGNAYATGENVRVNYIDSDPAFAGESSVDAEGEITYGRNANFDDDDYDYELPDASGFGADLGFVYEWRPNHADYKSSNSNGNTYNHKDKNKYKLKIGLSITDIGSINYKEGIQDTYSIPETEGAFTEDDFDNADDIEDFLETQYGGFKTSSSNGYTVNLPTALHFNADWSFTSKLYVNLNTDISLISTDNTEASRISNLVSLTPRFESKWFSFYVPISVVQYNGFQVGAGLRAGPLYVGSGSLLTGLTSDNSRGADVYAGLKIPVYQGQPKDKDEDGIIDKLDECPKIPGPIENNGCPWTDKDVDGIMDNLDECPDVKGPEENNGCPWGDADKDGVLDNEDACVDVAGPIENKGCPWKDSDNDSVYDKDDKCIDVPGTVANNGCPEEPEVTVAVQKALNDYAKTILFNSGKSSIKAESNTVLKEIVEILKEYPTAKFSIEGHTDSSGSDSLNQRLSDSRANAVKGYLIENGIDQFRLSAIGYGEAKPISSNATSAGRSQNRRVEINLVK